MRDDANATITTSKGRGASRKVRVYVFREWLLQTYGDYLSRVMSSEERTGDSNMPTTVNASGDQQQQRKRKRNCVDNQNIILDVAGGKGDLSWLLKNVDGLESIVVDPWKPDPKSVSRNDRMVRSIEYLRLHPEEANKRSVPFLPTYQPLAALMPRLLEERTKRLQLRNKRNNNKSSSDNEELPVSVILSSGGSGGSNAISGVPSTSSVGGSPCLPGDCLTPQLLQIPLDENMVERVRNRIIDEAKMKDETNVQVRKNDCRVEDECKDSVNDAHRDNILDLLSSGRIKLIVGFHPDQATEPCIDLARVLDIPFCVVPCCVFPSEFPSRRLRLGLSPSPEHPIKNDGSRYEQENEQQLVPVRTYYQFLDYLRQKAANPNIYAHISDRSSSPSTIHTAHLDFPFTETAKNIVLYTLPPSHLQSEETS